MSAHQADLAELLDERGISRLQILVFVLCGAAVFVDGFDTQAIGYVAPKLALAFGLPHAAMGSVFAAGLFGLAIGAFLIAPIADRIGRRPVIVAATASFGLLTLLTAFASGFSELMALRFLTGLGLGGAIPNAIALTAEYSPERRRAGIVMVMFCGFPLGAAVGGLVAARLLAEHGWASVFLAGGGATLLLVPVLVGLLPESIRFLAIRRTAANLSFRASTTASRRIAALLTRLDPGIDWQDARITAHPAAPPSGGVRQLFTRRRIRTTLLLWVVYFMGLLDLYLLANWLPTTLHAKGVALENAVLATAMLQIGGIAGALTLGLAVTRLGPARVMPLAYAGGAACIVAIGLIGSSALLALLTAFGAGFAIIGCQNCNNGLAASLYPTEIRATGVGWANAVGRAGSIIGPTLGGIMLSVGSDISLIFIAAALPALLASFAVLALTRRR